ncbi:MAG: type II secretion system F family protein [Thermoguttaceae bacterium]|nr:type II secretion system F family protein [Thermoguttaceae bacterium]
MDLAQSFVLPSILTAVAVGMLVAPAQNLWVRESRRMLRGTLDEFDRISYSLPKLDFWLSVWGFCVGASLVAGFVTMKPILGLSLALVFIVVPKQLLMRMLRKRRNLLKEQLITGITNLSNYTKAGVAIERAFDELGKNSPDPLGQEFRNIAFECEKGRVFSTVLEESKKRIQFQEYVIFITALLTNKKRGGDATSTLMEIKKSLSENRRLDRKLAADTAAGRLTIVSLACVPFAFLFVINFMNPEGTKLLFSETIGNAIILLATILTYAGYRWGQKIVDIEF